MKHLSYLFLLVLLFGSGCGSTKKLQQLLLDGSRTPAAFSETISYEEVGGLIVVEAKLGGATRRFLFDTGAPNLISKELAREIGAVVHTRQRVRDSQGKAEPLEFAYLDSLEIGGVTFYQTGAIIADLSASVELSCYEVEGIIGANLMRLACWQIDYQRKELHFASHRDSLSIPEGAVSIPFQASLQGSPSISMQLGSKRLQALIDSGSNSGFDGSLTTLQELRKELSFPAYSGFGSNQAGLFGLNRDTSYLGLLPDVRLDTISFGPQVVEFQRPSGAKIGNEFFRQFLVTLDWQANELLLNAVTAPPPAGEPTFGLNAIYDEGKLRVGFVWDGSPAAEAGIEPGDRILFMNGLDFINLPVPKYCQYLLARPLKYEWQTLDLFLEKDGGTQKISLQKRDLFSAEGTR